MFNYNDSCSLKRTLIIFTNILPALVKLGYYSFIGYTLIEALLNAIKNPYHDGSHRDITLLLVSAYISIKEVSLIAGETLMRVVGISGEKIQILDNGFGKYKNLKDMCGYMQDFLVELPEVLKFCVFFIGS